MTTEIWTQERLEKLIADRVEESLYLEYKAAASLYDNKVSIAVSKEVSSFANADGGTIIYGIAEHPEQDKRHRPERLDPVIRSEFSKERLDSIIAANIRPAIESLKISPVAIDGSDEKVVYVVEIPKSTTAHQAGDFCFYRRHNFQSKPMYEYEISELKNRLRYATVKARAKIVINQLDWSVLHFEIQNESNIMVRHFGVVIHSPVKWKQSAILYEEAIVDHVDGYFAFRLSFTNGMGAPLFPLSKRYENFKFKLGSFSKEPENPLRNLRYRLYADSAPPVEGCFEIDALLNGS